MSAISTSANLITHMLTMPTWQKVLLTIAGVSLACGLTGQATGYFMSPKSAPPPVAQPGSARSVVSQPNQAEAPVERPLYAKLSPHATRIGLTFIVGFIIGWAFRAFLKMMAMITILGGAIFFGLSRFNVMHVDLSGVEKKYESSKTWVTDQAWRLKDVVQTHLPSSGASLVGMFIGFRRKI